MLSGRFLGNTNKASRNKNIIDHRRVQAIPNQMFYILVAHLKADSVIIGQTVAEEAQIQQWVQFADCSVGPYLGAWIYPILGYSP